MRKVLAIAATVLLVGTAACSEDSDARPAGGSVQAASSVAVDTPELQTMRSAAGLEPCAAGPGDGELPDLTLPCLGGGTSVDLASLRGPLVLNFWGSWCGPCGEEMPILQSFHESYGGAVPVLGIDWQDPYPATALEQLQERGVTYPSLADPIGQTAETAEFARTSRGMPATFLIDADGSIAYLHQGVLESEDELVDLVREHLGVDL